MSDRLPAISKDRETVIGRLLYQQVQLLIPPSGDRSVLPEIPADKVAETKAKVERGELHPRAVKDMLGQEVVARFIGDEEAQNASEEFTRVFAQKELPDEIPEVVLPAEELGLLSLMVQAGLCKSNGEARRLIKQGAVKINDEKITDDRAQILPENGMIIRSGKRGFAQVKIG